jgi:hypothetical protein
MSVISAPAPVSLRAVALPSEHGGWGLLLEPILLGLLVAPSGAGMAVAVAAAAAFLSRHPARLVFTDWRRGMRYPRTTAALGFTAGYAAVASVGFAIAVVLARASLLPVLAAVAPIAALYLASDLRLKSREWYAELAGAVALGSSAALVARADGWPLGPALGLWLLLAGRAVSSVLEVRCRLRRWRGAPADRRIPLAVHVASVAASGVAAAVGIVPLSAPIVAVAFLARSLVNLSAPPQREAPMSIGWKEAASGALAVALWAVSYRVESP